MKIIIKLKIGRVTYDITDEDKFMDNGSSVQLITQSRENVTWGQRINPVLTKKAIKEISVFTRLQIAHGYSDKVKVFSLAG